MTIVLPHGVLFRGGEEGTIRKNLIENNNIDTIIGLPANIFFGTGIPTIIMVLKQRRSNTDVLIVDASKGFEKVGKNNKLRSSDIKRVVDVVTHRQGVDKFSKVVTRDEIRQNDYNLNIPRYVDSSEKAESWDIYASMFGGVPSGEIDELSQYWAAFPELKEALFADTDKAYLHFVVSDIKKAIMEHSDIRAFESRFNTAFADFREELSQELLSHPNDVNISKEESVLATQVFARLEGIPLVDRYEAYQLLDNEWARIAVDLEIIQTEGFDAVRKVDPNMVVKKKGDKETEVQDGWLGHVMPFELVQAEMLPSDVAELRKKEERLAEIVSEYDELLEELPEEEKEKAFVNDDKTAFVVTEVKNALKAKDEEPVVLAVLKKFDTLVAEEKELKKIIKLETADLEMKTKATIEGLSDEQANELLKAKWILPIVQGLKKLPESIVTVFSAKLEVLAKKYETTLKEVEQQISETEIALSAMIDDLTGDEFDQKGLAELKKLLTGEQEEK